MSLLTEASLVIMPNAVEEGKLFSIIPADGSGDMTAVRATTATLVNSEGVIEDCPYNLLRRSQEFDNAIWSKINTTITTNSIIAPNGTLTSKTLTDNSTNGIHVCGNDGGSIGINTFSFYAKANTLTRVGLLTAAAVNVALASTAQVFDLSNGTIVNTISGVTATITNVGNGWYRCSVTLTALAGGTYFITCIKTGTNIGYIGSGENLYIWGAQLVTGTQPKEYFPTTNRLNVPRLDYTNGSCPSILVEPQRTNLALRSQEFSNSIWTTNGNQITISENSTISPDGTNSADAILTTTENSSHYIQQIKGTATAGVTYTMSIYVKKLGYDYCRIQASNTATAYATFRFSTKDLILGGVNVVANSGKVTEMPNGWFRIEISMIPPFGVTWRWWVIVYDDLGNETFIGDVSKGLYVWGFQFEAGSNATSYIPTVASAVTRNADVISKTGISDLINSEEGVFYTQIAPLTIDSTSRDIEISDGNTNRVIIQFNNTGISAFVIVGGVVQASLNFNNSDTDFKKVALRYKVNDFALFVNGVKIAFDTSGATFPPNTLTRLDLKKVTPSTLEYNGTVKTLCSCKTALPITQLTQLTTP